MKNDLNNYLQKIKIDSRDSAGLPNKMKKVNITQYYISRQTLNSFSYHIVPLAVVYRL